jgi:hypothetical protein
MKKTSFEGGGFVLHHITVDFKGRCSAWYDKEGILLDCQIIRDRELEGRPVKYGGKIHKRLVLLGKVWKEDFQAVA